MPVRAIFNDDTFELWGVEKPSRQACVLGKRVDEFGVVDYDQPFTRNLGATRQLAAENQALKARIAALEQAVASLQKQK
jgi:cell division protein FtsB